MFALVHLAALVLAALLWRRSGQHAFGLLVLVAAALTWDNTIIACGRLIGAGELLRALSIPRYVGHAFFTPLLIPLCVALAAQLGLSAFAKRWVVAAFGVLAIALIAVGVSTDVIALRLEPKAYADTLRYVNAAAAGPPVPTLIVSVAATAVAIPTRRGPRGPAPALQ